MPDLRTTVTEVTTALGMLGYDSVADALIARPAEMVSMSPEQWDQLALAYKGTAYAAEFESAWENGVAFLHAVDGLRRRKPKSIEWKGTHRAPGDEVAPIDLRIDHVYLVSCKYLSKIVINASPFHLFDRLLQGGHGFRDTDWYSHVSHDLYQLLYEVVRGEKNLTTLPRHVDDLEKSDREQLKEALQDGWPAGTAIARSEFISDVSLVTAAFWQEQLETSREQEAMFWRMLRMGSAPYFVLGNSKNGPLRLRVATPWDWRLRYRFRSFDVAPQAGGQPRVAWRAVIEDRNSSEKSEVSGHVEVRWSHGPFSGNPEAKVYLDTAHADVPGYFPLA